jgi:hypothetical protein
MKTLLKPLLTALALAALTLAAQAQPDVSDRPPAPPAPPAPSALPPELPVQVAEQVRIAVDAAFAGQILSREKVVKGAPYCAQAVHETVQPLMDGNRIVHQQTSLLCRDAEGRTRQEIERQGRKWIYLRDPVGGDNWLLDPQRKTARYLGRRVDESARREETARQRDYAERMREYARQMKEWTRVHGERLRNTMGAAPVEPPQPPAPPQPPMAPRAVVIAPVDGGHDLRVVQVESPDATAMPVPIPAAVGLRAERAASLERSRPEALPPREVEGLKLTGQRFTSTIEAGKVGNEKPIVLTREVWTSPELQITVSSQDRDPRSGEQNYQLRQIRRGEPDAALMKVPADFKKSGEPTPKKG